MTWSEVSLKLTAVIWYLHLRSSIGPFRRVSHNLIVQSSEAEATNGSPRRAGWTLFTIPW